MTIVKSQEKKCQNYFPDYIITNSYKNNISVSTIFFLTNYQSCFSFMELFILETASKMGAFFGFFFLTDFQKKAAAPVSFKKVLRFSIENTTAAFITRVRSVKIKLDSARLSIVFW